MTPFPHSPVADALPRMIEPFHRRYGGKMISWWHRLVCLLLDHTWQTSGLYRRTCGRCLAKERLNGNNVCVGHDGD